MCTSSHIGVYLYCSILPSVFYLWKLTDANLCSVMLDHVSVSSPPDPRTQISEPWRLLPWADDLGSCRVRLSEADSLSGLHSTHRFTSSVGVEPNRTRL